MDLSPWNERDPFHKEGDLPSVNHIEPNNEVFSSANTVQVTSQKPIAQLDFNSEAPVLITARPSSSNKKTTVDNKLDLPTSTTKKPPKKRPTTTRRPFPTIVDNKLDFGDEQTSTTRPNSPFSKLGKDSQTSTTKVKRSTSKIRKPPKISPEPRSVTWVGNVMTKLFANEDNATKYMNNRPVTTRLDSDAALESRVSSRYDYNNDFDYQDKPHRPTYDYSSSPEYGSRPDYASRPYPPLTQTTSKRPLPFQNYRPTDYADVQMQNRPTGSPISNKYSTPFSYDTFRVPPASMIPQINYDNMAIPLYISPNRVNNRPTFNRPTTRKMNLSTFFIVETTRQTTTRPDRQPSYSTDSSSILFLNKFPSIADSSVADDDSDGYDSTNLSYLISSNTNKASQKQPLHDSLKPFSSDANPSSVFSNDDFDGYLRPETSFYIPVKTKHKTSSYNDYSMYNRKTEPTKTSKSKFYYVNNEYFEGRSDEGLHRQPQTKRYAEFYDEGWRDKDQSDDSTRTMTDRDNTQDDLTMTLTARSRRQNVFLVPFQLLTKIERPDNWVVTQAMEIGLKPRLPEVPPLKQDHNTAKELPKPFLNRHRN